ncbi:TraR/DksA family transcriptional regulator [Aestuariicoccus sp. MJ-SS9]|uniref:TraR/DksA family transcriptional regulator n=1 Tax=Aestuariicoccus sp. MJ-SS9 TaxID=3079855 RepID=UPI002906AC60|nr:TraR/DksA C4-type zinc finger protein [Aestuariicoccus sp. MJ-SS9]MDU8913725.1 TraR/DksA C4-type zinc finger protein [Aestuariicoccus sp. MJ-SS9]
MAFEKHKKQLEDRLNELGVRLSHIDTELTQPHVKDLEDMAVEMEDEEVLERLGASGQAEIGRITRALKRIADGEYGVCLECGGEISEERLDVVPDAPLCRNCAAGGSA